MEGGRMEGRTWKKTTIQRFSLNFHKKQDGATIVIDLKCKSMTAQRLSSMSNEKKHESATIVIDVELTNTTVQRFPSLCNEKARRYTGFHRFWTMLNDSTTMFTVFPKQTQLSIAILTFWNHPRAHVTIFIAKMKEMEPARLARGNGIFRRRSQPRKLVHRS